MTPIPFAQQLEKDWQFITLAVSPTETVITVRTSLNHPVPSPVGREGLSILSYPAIHSEREQAEFAFRKCLYVRIWDESSFSMLHVDPDQQFEGRLFRRYAKSALLDLHSKLPYPGVRFHYQLHCQNEIADIVCQSAPIVSLRRAVIEDKLASQSP
jgi:hypothetical protein